jgi:hypothetical protein
MGARRTERRLPAGLQGSDLGEAVSGPRCTLVSYATAPLAVARDNTYVLFVVDPTLAPLADSFEWTFALNGSVALVDTFRIGEAIFTPTSMGDLSITVRVLDAADAELDRVSMDQEVVESSADLETLIARSRNMPGPGAGDPEVLRELVNEHARYYQHASLTAAEAGDGFQRLLFTMAFDGVSQRDASERRWHLCELAAAVNDAPIELPRLAATGAGVCSVRLSLLAMTTPAAAGGTATHLPWTEVPESGARHAFEEDAVRAKLASLGEDARVDLFNRVRFPKSNIASCARVLEALRDRYFRGSSFDDVLTGMSGTRAAWMAKHYRDGPLARQ